MSTSTLTTIDREPLAIRAAVTTAVTAVVHVAAVLGLPLDQAAELAIGAAVDAVGLVVLLVWTRPNVTANAKVIARVTNDGTVVAGDAAAISTGSVIATAPNLGGTAPQLDEPVVIKPGLVASGPH